MAGDNFDLLRVTVTSELQSFQEWIHANKLAVNYDQVTVYLSLETNSSSIHTEAVYILENRK